MRLALLLAGILAVVSCRSATLLQAPYQANLVLVDPTTDDEENCSGSVVHPRWLLTAAHCLVHLADPRYLNVSVGSELFLGGKPLRYESPISHELWNSSPNNDVALIRLKDSIVFDERVRPVTLTRRDNYENAILTSWGQATSDTPALELLYKNLSVVGEKQCRLQLGRLLRQLRITNYEDFNFFLAALQNLNSLICTSGAKLHHGDSGGPLVINGTLQIGIASSSYMGRQGLFTRVSSFVDWIQFQMNKYGDEPQVL